MILRTPVLRPRRLIDTYFFHSTPSTALLLQRCVHSSRPKNAVAAAALQDPTLTVPPPYSPKAFSSTSRTSKPDSSLLSMLSTTQVLRTYLITRMSSSPILLRTCFAVLRRMLDSKSILMNPDKNPVLRWVFKRTFYAQFCAGENKEEAKATVDRTKKMGFTGVILEYAPEVLEAERPGKEITDAEIALFRQGMLDTIEVAGKGDFLGLKWSGLGRESFYLIKHNEPPSPEMEACIYELCDAAKAKGAIFLPGAEEEYMNYGVDSWTLDLQKKYNKDKPFMYMTYQAYLRSTPAKLAQHLVKAAKEGYIPGIKVVRGAYLLSEPKEAVWSSWEETNRHYDGIIEALLKRQWNDVLKSPTGDPSAPFPKVGVMLASHNAESIRKAREIRNEQARNGEERVELAYAQLQGMADELSCELVAASKTAEGATDVDRPRPFKCATWGTLEECMHFLVRRASENQDAMGRTVGTRQAMAAELTRRARGCIGLS